MPGADVYHVECILAITKHLRIGKNDDPGTSSEISDGDPS
jgi:hypothetical protein